MCKITWIPVEGLSPPTTSPAYKRPFRRELCPDHDPGGLRHGAGDLALSGCAPRHRATGGQPAFAMGAGYCVLDGLTTRLSGHGRPMVGSQSLIDTERSVTRAQLV